MGTVKENDVAIVIPLFLRDHLIDSELISLAHLRKHLGRYTKFYLAAEGLNMDKIDQNGMRTLRFPKKYFGSAKKHNQLLTNPIFYETFKDYKFILIYHLDSLVFSDQLLFWCEQDYDCIAPPWMASDYRWLDVSIVGNGGFALRKVETFIKLYHSNVYWQEPIALAKKTCTKYGLPQFLFSPLLRSIFKIRYFNNIKRHLNYYLDQKLSAEDRFIAMYGNHYLPELKLAPPEVAIKFAFERYPDKYFKQNNNELPFGCHAYERFDREFWEPYLIHPNGNSSNVKAAATAQ